MQLSGVECRLGSGRRFYVPTFTMCSGTSTTITRETGAEKRKLCNAMELMRCVIGGGWQNALPLAMVPWMTGYTVNTTSPEGNKSISNIIIVGSGTTKTLARRVEGYVWNVITISKWLCNIERHPCFALKGLKINKFDCYRIIGQAKVEFLLRKGYSSIGQATEKRR